MTQSFTKTRTEVRYVCGFLFAPQWNQVALIRKAKPEWQKGKYNGVGGKMEQVGVEVAEGSFVFRPETPLEAMTREFEEETGVRIENWQFFATVRDAAHGGYAVHFFQATTDRLWDFRKDTDEQAAWVPLEYVHRQTIPVISNLTWLIPLALDPNLGDDRVTNEPPG